MNTLRARLISVFLIVAIAGVGAVGFISLTRARRAIIDSAGKEGAAYASALAMDVNDYLQERAKILEIFAGLHSVRSMNWEEQQPALAPLYDRYNFSDIFVADLDGATTDVKLGPQKVNVKDREYFATAVREKKTVVSQPAVNRRTGALSFFYATPVMKGGEVTAVLVAGENMDNISKIAASMVWGQNGYAYLLDRSGVIVAHRVQEFVGTLNPSIESDKVAPELARGMRDGLTGRSGRIGISSTAGTR